MTTAAEAIQQSSQERQRRVFELQIESFLNQWAPDDRYERSQFESQFHSLVRQIYMEAQQPLLDQINKIAMAIPFPPSIIVR